MMDKVSFTIGISTICIGEYLLLRSPVLFPILYYGLMSTLILVRYLYYANIRSELYLTDFCYFMNFSVMLQTALYPDNLEWFQANYVLSMGPLCLAIVAWRNSLILNRLDNITSFFLHSFPALVCHVYRWKLVDSNLNFTNDYMGLYRHIVLPLALYSTWQIAYLFITEIVLRDTLAKYPEMVTSLRYLARDKKNPINRITLAICRKLGMVRPLETLDPDTTIAKIVFVLAQLVYAIFTIFHTAYLYTTFQGSCLYLVFVFLHGVWNGGLSGNGFTSIRYSFKLDVDVNDARVIHDDDDDDEIEHIEDELLNQALDNLDLSEEEFYFLLNDMIDHQLRNN